MSISLELEKVVSGPSLAKGKPGPGPEEPILVPPKEEPKPKPICRC